MRPGRRQALATKAGVSAQARRPVISPHTHTCHVPWDQDTSGHMCHSFTLREAQTHQVRTASTHQIWAVSHLLQTPTCPQPGRIQGQGPSPGACAHNGMHTAHTRGWGQHSVEPQGYTTLHCRTKLSPWRPVAPESLPLDHRASQQPRLLQLPSTSERLRPHCARSRQDQNSRLHGWLS